MTTDPTSDPAATPFEADIAEQPAALRRLAGSDLINLDRLTARPWSRIVLTGMGSSHFAGHQTWRRLTALGHPCWAIDSGELLDNPGLVTPDTLLIITSQSGASGEVVALLERRDAGELVPGLLVAVTDDERSPLAKAADVLVALQSGPEATVSTKSFLNTLAAHRLVGAAFAGDDVDRVRTGELAAAAAAVQTVIDDVDLTEAALRAATHPQRRLAFVGAGDSAGTALFAALITKESAKIAAEGFVGGQFRHGPFELAGDGLTVVIFAPERDRPDASLRQLAVDLVATGTFVIVVGDPSATASLKVTVPSTDGLSFTASSSVVAELFAVGLARGNGVVPGAFVHGSKITTTI